MDSEGNYFDETTSGVGYIYVCIALVVVFGLVLFG
jgi:hypothetical protein